MSVCVFGLLVYGEVCRPKCTVLCPSSVSNDIGAHPLVEFFITWMIGLQCAVDCQFVKLPSFHKIHRWQQNLFAICLFAGRVSPPGDYCQLIPSKTSKHRVVPPVLPNQLLQIVLNQDVSPHVCIIVCKYSISIHGDTVLYDLVASCIFCTDNCHVTSNIFGSRFQWTYFNFW